MIPSTKQPSISPSVDEDLAEQALPGHGIPSQDPDATAQFALNSEEAQRDTKSELAGGGVIAGAAAGAAIGVAVVGPVGVMVGAAAGVVVAALGGAAAAATATDEDTIITYSGPAGGSHPHIQDVGH
jgi:hypothetical protein